MKTHLVAALAFILPICWIAAVFAPAQKLHAQAIIPASNLARLLPVDSLALSAATGGKVFSDREIVFQSLPAELAGTSYIQGSMERGVKFLPATGGIFYVVTPLTGEPGSQQAYLEGDGFLKISEPQSSVFSGQSARIGIFRKTIPEPSKFDPRKIYYNSTDLKGWAVPFFSSEKLPSIAVAAKVIWSPGEKYALKTRLWQGCPSIEKTGGRLWTAWFSGGETEPAPDNYGIVAYSDDDGSSWTDPAMIIVHPDRSVRIMDTQIWKDPRGRLWIFWTQNTGPYLHDSIWGTWAIRIDDPDAATPTWTPPRRLCDGLTRNKVTVLSTGEWLLPSYDWVKNQSTVYASSDEGDTWQLRGGPLNKSKSFYEHMLVELKDGRIWMLQRAIKESHSENGGRDWTPLQDIPAITSASSRLYIRRLNSGNLLLVYNDDPERKIRKSLTALLSTDDGKTWPHRLVLDERTEISYPDAVQDDSGLIYLTYDRARTREREILLTTFTEDDVRAGHFQSDRASQWKTISKVNE